MPATLTRRLLLPLCMSACAALLAACGSEKPAAPVAAKPPAPEAAKAPAAPPAAAPAPVAAAPDADKTLAASVKEALRKAMGPAATRIDVTAKAGAVTLWGSVNDAAEKDRVAALAGKVDGVRSVENKLQVVTGS